MTDLLTTLPSFPTAPYTHLIPSLERALITTTDLLTLDALEVAKRAQLPPLDVKRLIAHVLATLQAELGVGVEQNVAPVGGGKRFDDVPREGEAGWGKLRTSGEEVMRKPLDQISLGDEALDAVLGGGIPIGYITEIVGESGAGKTQLLLSLLLLAQLPPASGGLACPTLYISTEHPLPTARLTQILASHPRITSLLASSPHRPSLAKVLSIQVPDLESQDHILTYQLPVALARHRIRLVVIDSIAANYRAEKSGVAEGDDPSIASNAGSSSNGGGGGGGGDNNNNNSHRRRQAAALASRSALLVKLGGLLRSLAREHDCAIVVANQVSDRFTTPFLPSSTTITTTSSNPSAHLSNHQHAASQRSTTTPSSSSSISSPSQHHAHTMPPPPANSTPYNNNNNNNTMTATAPAVLSLDHQLRFFSGWGAAASSSDHRGDLKTPALGLTWANQIAGRVVLVKAPPAGYHGSAARADPPPPPDDAAGGARRWRRWIGVAFAAWCAPRGQADGDGGREFEVWRGGVRGLGWDGEGTGTARPIGGP